MDGSWLKLSFNSLPLLSFADELWETDSGIDFDSFLDSPRLDTDEENPGTSKSSSTNEPLDVSFS